MVASLDHAAFRLNNPNAENVIDNNIQEHVVTDKPAPTLSRHALGRPNRRAVLASGAASFVFGGALCARAQDKVAPITIVINTSPWFNGFKNIVEVYEKESGNKVELDVNPFAGSLEKQRNSVRAAKGLYDLLIMNSGWFAEMYFGGFCEALSDIDTGFKLDPGVYTHNDTVFFNPADKSMTP